MNLEALPWLIFAEGSRMVILGAAYPDRLERSCSTLELW